MIEVSYERASRINHTSLGFICVVPILAPTALKKGAVTEVAKVGVPLPCLQYARHLFNFYLLIL